MKKFISNLKAQAEANPIAALMVGALVFKATSQLIDAQSAASGRRAYAKQVDYRIMNQK
jgi:hypothetical protein